jgi:hypothetical protein
MIDRAVPADSVERTVPAVLWFTGWLAVGAGAVLAMLAALTIGVFILPLCIVATVVLATRRGSSQGFPGLVSGLSLPLFYVAYLNRDGPGTICTRSVSSVSCTDEWSPWPWFAVGAVLLLGGVLLFHVTQIQRTGRG